MSNNCYAKKYKKDSNNNNLSFLNGLNLIVTGNAAIYSPGKNRSIIIGDGHFCSNNTYSDDLGKETFANTLLYVATSSSCMVVIFNKYDLTDLTSEDNRNVGVNIDGLKYSDKLKSIAFLSPESQGDLSSLAGLTLITRLRLNNSQVKGNLTDLMPLTSVNYVSLNSCHNVHGTISAFASRTSLNYLNLWGSGATGDIYTLGALISLTTLELPSAIVGTLESLIEGMWSNGRRSGNLVVYYYSSNITLHGVKSTRDERWNCTFANKGVSIVNSVDSSITASYNGTSWTYQNI